MMRDVDPAWEIPPNISFAIVLVFFLPSEEYLVRPRKIYVAGICLAR